MEKSNVGRPRLYGSSAEKMSAFRSKQLSIGYVRKEVLVSEESQLALSALATKHGVSVLDVASSILEEGVKRLQLEEQLTQINGALSQSALIQGSPLVTASSANQITEFFNKRKKYK
ncbi:hypothetical protein LC612_33815 [Nostoc sp. CHAB 5834]|nr:hypothetical protein [Nostoc sp. CHAB 5834]